MHSIKPPCWACRLTHSRHLALAGHSRVALSPKRAAGLTDQKHQKPWNSSYLERAQQRMGDECIPYMNNIEQWWAVMNIPNISKPTGASWNWRRMLNMFPAFASSILVQDFKGTQVGYYCRNNFPCECCFSISVSHAWLSQEYHFQEIISNTKMQLMIFIV